MIEVSLTGIEDRQTPWKYLIAGAPGSGKTALASTASNPWFLFFAKEPRLKSIADRSIPHSKIVNQVEDGALVRGVEEQIIQVLLHLRENPEYDTLVFDTLDEYQMRLKEERRLRNGGEWSVNDWNWLSDTFRESVQAFIDLPMRIIANVHVKSVHDGDHSHKELLLQGPASDEAPGWFDVVGALDTYQLVNDSGETITKRVLLSAGSRKYPWLKDHSYQLPHRFELSDNFVGDFTELEKIITGGTFADAHREVIAVIEPEDGVPNESDIRVVTPDMLDAQKAVNTETLREASDEQKNEFDVTPFDEKGYVQTTPPPSPAPPPDKPEEIPISEASEGDASSEQPDPMEAAEELIEKEIGTVKGNFCVECGEEVDDNMVEISQLRYRKVLCRPHYKTAGDQ